MLHFSRNDRQHIMQLIEPSWLSGFLAVALGLLITIGVIVAFSLSSSSVQRQLVSWQSTKPTRTLTTPDQILEENDRPTLQGSWPLIVVWSCVGLITYAIAISIVHSISNAASLHKSLRYINADPHKLLANAAGTLILKILAGIVLASLIYLFFHSVVPYAITAAHASAADVVSLDGLLDALLAFAVVAFSIHLQAIFLRLTLGKIRALSNSI